MIANVPTIRLTRRPAARALAAAAGFLSITAITGWPPVQASPSARISGAPLKAQIAHDKAFVSRRHDNCAAFRPSPAHCPFKVATTPNGKHGHLIAVDITQQTGDDCYRGRVFFFTGRQFLASTRRLPPRSFGGVKGVRAAGIARFKVIYRVSASAGTSCAMNGNAGTDPYVYAWNGQHMVKESGTPPAPPKVIVGT